MKTYFLSLLTFILSVSTLMGQNREVVFSGSTENDMYSVLENSGFKVTRFDSPDQAIEYAKKGMPVLLIADGYPTTYTTTNSVRFEKAKKKKLRVFVEYPSYIPGFEIPSKPIRTKLERVPRGWHRTFRTVSESGSA